MNLQETTRELKRAPSNSRKFGPDPRILLTETVRWPNVALLAIDFAKAGCDVSAVCPARHPLHKTRAVRQTYPYSGLRPLESVLAAIEATNPQFIVPCDDRAVQHLQELHAQALGLGAVGTDLALLIENSLGSPGSYPIVCDRHELVRIARAEGLRVPDTIPLKTTHDLKSWQEHHMLPWVMKADGTFAGDGVKIVHTLEQAERSLLELSRFYTVGRAVKRLCVNRDAFWLRPWWNGTQPAVTVQSYIRGRPANCAVLCSAGRVLAGIGVEVVSSARPTGPANVVRVVDNADMMLAAERIAKRLGLSGFFGLDFMIEESSGLTYLIELNPRPTRLSHLQLGKGRDLIGALCAELSGKPFRDVPPATQKSMIAYFPDGCNRKSEVLDSTFQDVPEGEPELCEELLKPWPPQGVLWCLVTQVDRIKMFLRRSRTTLDG